MSLECTLPKGGWCCKHGDCKHGDCCEHGGTFLPAGPTTGRDEYTPSNHPLHYNQHPAGVECIDIIEGYSYNVGNAMKYLWRAGLKGSALDDLRKAKVSIDREIAMMEKRLPSIQDVRGIMADVDASHRADPVPLANEPDVAGREEPEQHQCFISAEHPRHTWGHRSLGEVECPGVGCQDLDVHPAHYSERSGTQCPGQAYGIT